MADAADTQHWLDLIEETTKRLHARQKQRAQYGYDTPPYILTEIEQCEKDIELYRAQLSVGVQPSEKAQNEVPGDAQQLLIEYRLKQQDEKISDALTGLARALEHLTEKVHAIDAKGDARHSTEQEVRRERQEENDARFTGIEQQQSMLIETTSRMRELFDIMPLRIASIVIVGSVITIAIVFWMTR